MPGTEPHDGAVSKLNQSFLHLGHGTELPVPTGTWLLLLVPPPGILFPTHLLSTTNHNGHKLTPFTALMTDLPGETMWTQGRESPVMVTIWTSGKRETSGLNSIHIQTNFWVNWPFKVSLGE